MELSKKEGQSSTKATETQGKEEGLRERWVMGSVNCGSAVAHNPRLMLLEVT